MAVMDEFKEERERMKSQPFKKRLEYFWDYHKIHIIIIACVLFMGISLIGSITNQKETALSIALIDCYSNEGEIKNYNQELAELLGIDTNKEKIVLDNSFYLSNMDTPDASSAEVLSLRIMAKELDVMLSKEAIFNRYVQNGIFKDLREVLSPEQLAYYQDSFYYVDQAVIDKGEIYEIDFAENAFVDNTDHTTPEGMEQPIPVGIYVTGTEEFQGVYYFSSDDQEVVFGIPFYSEHAEYALKFLDDMSGRVQ